MALPPLQNLLDLLPDNTQGLIEPNDLRSITTDLYAGIVANGDTLLGYVRTDGAVTMDDGYEPSATLSVATKGYVDSVLFPKNFVQITGSQMSGDLFLPLYLPTEYTQAAHKGYVDSAVSAGVQGVVTTDTTNYKLITETPEGVKVRGLKASQNVVLTDDGTDITIKANVAGTGGDVRTDVSNVYDANTVQTIPALTSANIDAENIDAKNIDAENIDAENITTDDLNVGDTLNEVIDKNVQQDQAIGFTLNETDSLLTVNVPDTTLSTTSGTVITIPLPNRTLAQVFEIDISCLFVSHDAAAQFYLELTGLQQGSLEAYGISHVTSGYGAAAKYGLTISNIWTSGSGGRQRISISNQNQTMPAPLESPVGYTTAHAVGRITIAPEVTKLDLRVVGSSLGGRPVRVARGYANLRFKRG